MYKINAKYLRITCYGRVLGFLGGGIKGKEKITKFDTNKNIKRQKYLIKLWNTNSFTSCILPKSIYFFLQD